MCTNLRRKKRKLKKRTNSRTFHEGESNEISSNRRRHRLCVLSLSIMICTSSILSYLTEFIMIFNMLQPPKKMQANQNCQRNKHTMSFFSLFHFNQLTRIVLNKFVHKLQKSKDCFLFSLNYRL